MVNACCVNLCKYKYKTKKHRFPHFQKDEARFNKWVVFCENQQLSSKTPENIYRNCRVCEQHFIKVDYFVNGSLKLNAVPTIKVTTADSDVQLETNTDTNFFNTSDHTYIASQKSTTSDTTVNENATNNESSSYKLLKLDFEKKEKKKRSIANQLKLLCRLCGREKTDLLPMNEDYILQMNINKFFDLEDNNHNSNILPKGICFYCYETVATFSDFVHNVKEIQKYYEDVTDKIDNNIDDIDLNPTFKIATIDMKPPEANVKIFQDITITESYFKDKIKVENGTNIKKKNDESKFKEEIIEIELTESDMEKDQIFDENDEVLSDENNKSTSSSQLNVANTEKTDPVILIYNKSSTNLPKTQKLDANQILPKVEPVVPVALVANMSDSKNDPQKENINIPSMHMPTIE